MVGHLFVHFHVSRQRTFDVRPKCSIVVNRLMTLKAHNKMKVQVTFLTANLSLELVTSFLVSHPRVLAMTSHQNTVPRLDNSERSPSLKHFALTQARLLFELLKVLSRPTFIACKRSTFKTFQHHSLTEVPVHHQFSQGQ